jgi:regulator of nonsense transcripts 2
VFLQNYYWFKKTHPVFASSNESGGDLFPHLIEHMYKECLHNLRPKMKLFKTYEKAQEEVEKLRMQLYPNLGEAGDGDGKTLGTINENESDYTSEALMETDDEMKPRSENEEYHDDFNEDEEENSQMDEAKSQDQKPEKSEEDLQFEAMFEKMATDSLQERVKESSKVNTRDIPVPMTTRVAKKTYEQLQETENKTADAVPFVLMVRNTKSGKQQFKNFAAPLDSELAVNLKLQEQKIKEENEKVKQLTLQRSERLEEEEFQESLQQKQAAFNKRQKFKPYKHQFGVPDTDNIFH